MTVEARDGHLCVFLPPVETLVMGTTVTVLREDGAFAVTREG